MPATKEKTVAPDKIKMFNEHDNMMKRLLQDAENKLRELQGQREALIMKNVQIEEGISRKQSEFEQWKRLEEQKLQETKFKMQNDLIRREKAMEVGELDLSRRITECERREELGKVVVAKESKLNNDRIEIEKLRSAANLTMDNAQRMLSEASSVEGQVNIRLSKAKELENKANELNSSLVKRENIVAEKEKELTSATKNFEELKLIVEPKIKEIKEREDRVEKDKKYVLEKEKEVENKINEEKILLKDLDILQKRLKEKEKELDRRDEEITRKALIAGIDAK